MLFCCFTEQVASSSSPECAFYSHAQSGEEVLAAPADGVCRDNCNVPPGEFERSWAMLQLEAKGVIKRYCPSSPWMRRVVLGYAVVAAAGLSSDVMPKPDDKEEEEEEVVVDDSSNEGHLPGRSPRSSLAAVEHSPSRVYLTPINQSIAQIDRVRLLLSQKRFGFAIRP